MFNELFGRRTIDKKIEKKLVKLSLIPSKYFEALYIERSTDIPSHLLDLCEREEGELRGELLVLQKQGIVDTKIEVEKFGLFERIIDATSVMKVVRLLMTEYKDQIQKEVYKELVKILKNVSELGRVMHQTVEGLYSNYDEAIEKVKKLTESSKKIIANLTKFKFYNGEEVARFDLEDPKVQIGTAIRESVQSMLTVGEKILYIIEIFRFDHRDIL